MGKRKTVGSVLLIVGLAVLLLSLLADIISIGLNLSRFGPTQIFGVILGVILFAIGLILMLKKAKESDQSS